MYSLTGKTMVSKNILKNILRNVGAITFITFSMACEKKRDVTIKDENVRTGILAIADLQAKNFQLQTSSEIINAIEYSTTSDDDKLKSGPTNTALYKSKAKFEKPLTTVEKSTLPAKVSALIEKTPVIASPSTSYTLKTVVDSASLRLYKVVVDTADLTVIEKALAKKNQDSFEVPFLKIKVSSFGRLKRDKDDNGNETSTMSLDTNVGFTDSTHFILSNKSEDILLLGEELDDKETLKEVFLTSALDKKVYSLSQLVDQLKLGLKGFQDGKVFTQMDQAKGSSGNLNIFRITTKDKITDDLVLAQLKNGSAEVKTCPADVLAQLDSTEKNNCVLILAYSVETQNVAPKADMVKADGKLTEQVRFKPYGGSNPTLVQIKEFSIPTPIARSEISPYNSLSLIDLKTKEFIYRRTFEDGAATIAFFGPGGSGSLEIVKFVPQETRIVIRRADAMSDIKNAGDIDKEELMSIPVKYFKKDTNGSVNVPKYIPTTLDTAEIAVLNWSENKIPISNSPLSSLEDGACFESTSDSSITNMDNSFAVDNKISFSIQGSYNFKDFCLSSYNMNDYWYSGKTQTNYLVRERISFVPYDRNTESKNLFDMPFPVQNQLGFGVFTYNKRVADRFGNTASMNTEIARPVIQDFSNGKSFVYTLGGLPPADSDENKMVREALAQGTFEVIKDWNISLLKAFKGTALERDIDANPYIQLELNESTSEFSNIRPTAKVGYLGDLDKNFIWNFDKNMNSGLLGLSQAGPNPRTGSIVQNNVLMYSGNLLSQIGMLKARAKMVKDYTDKKEKALSKLINAQMQAEKKLADDKAKIEAKIMDEITAKPSANMTDSSKVLGNLMQDSSLRTSLISMMESADKNNLKKALKDEKLQQMGDATLYNRILKKAEEMNALQDFDTLRAIAAAEILKSKSVNLSTEERDELANGSQVLAMKANFLRNFRKGPNCALTDSGISNVLQGKEKNILDTKTEVILKDFYKITLAHEIGHSLGLTHNFMGSFDKNNFRFENEKSVEKDEEGRNYSSVMDYMPDTYLHYAGPGPYDVRALRVAYTGQIEVDSNFASKNSKQEGNAKFLTISQQKIPINDKNEISINDYKKVVLINQNWWKLEKQSATQIPVKTYSYCTDVHVGSSPLCNRWDLGTNPLEISQYFERQYINQYAFMNQRGNRISLPTLDLYISRTITNMMAQKIFINELFYKIFNGTSSQDELKQYLYASINAYLTLMNVLWQPTKELPFESEDRFALTQIKVPVIDAKTGAPKVDETTKAPVLEAKNALIEMKSLDDIYSSSGPNTQVVTRGIQYDSVLAMMMLSKRDVIHYKYAVSNVRFSFADFEKFILRTESYQDSLFLSYMSNYLKDQNVSFIKVDGNVYPLPIKYSQATNSLKSNYALLTAMAFLDTNTTDDKYNFSSLFRVGLSTQNVPSDRAFVTNSSQKLKSSSSLKFWAFDGADIISDVVETAAAQRIYLDNAADLSELLKNLTVAVFKTNSTKDANDKSAATAELKLAQDAFVNKLKEIDPSRILISQQINKSESELSYDELATMALKDTVKNVGILGQIMSNIGTDPKNAATAISAAIPDMESFVAARKFLVKSNPVYGLTEYTLLNSFKTSGGNVSVSDLFKQINGNSRQQENHDSLVNHLQGLNQLLIMFNPEFNR